MKVAVLGAGAWGTALGVVLSRNQHHVTLWSRDAAALAALQTTRRNERHLPGVELPADWSYEADLARLVRGQDALIVGVASVGFRSVAARLAGTDAMLISITKGIEFDTGLTMGGVLRQCAPGAPVAVLSGPTFAAEVARGMPTAIVAASDDDEIGRASCRERVWR